MLFRHNELGEQITALHLKEITDAQRSDRNAYYQRRYEMFQGIVTDPKEPAYNESLCLEFFPKGKNETAEEYRERMKVWVPQGRVIIERLADLVFKGGVEYKFVAINEADEEMAERATEVVNADLEYNDWDIVARERVTEPLGIGQVSDWLDFRRFDPRTGEAYDNFGRVRFVKRWPWFAEPVVHPDNVTEIIGAAYIYNLENEVISPAVSLQMTLDGSRKLITILWLDPAYNTDTGAKISNGAFIRLEDETVVMPEGKEEWQSENKYGLTPVEFWQSIDIDETQYNGQAFIDRFVDALLKLSRVKSNEVSAIQYIINQLAIIAAPEATPDELPIRHNAIFKIPQGDPQSDIRILDRKADLTPEQGVSKYLTFLIGQAGNFSADLMDIEGVKNAAQSGVARKIVYSATIDFVEVLRKNYAKNMKSVMNKILKVKEYEYGKLDGIDLKKIRPEVVFYGEIMPTDELEELTQDVMKLKEGLIRKTDLILKYNDDIDSLEKAEERLRAIQEERKATQPEEQTPSWLRRRNGTGNPNEKAGDAQGGSGQAGGEGTPPE